MKNKNETDWEGIFNEELKASQQVRPGIHTQMLNECMKTARILKYIKASFLRKGDGVSKYTASCIVHILETHLIGDFRNEVLLSSTWALEKIKHKLRNMCKQTYVWLKSYVTDATIYRIWTEAIYEVLRVTSQFVVHSFPP
jgi:hypothetical protein